MSICWYSDDEIEIIFDKLPDVSIRYALPSYSKDELKDINKKPFINLSNSDVEIIDKTEFEKYKFSIPKNYTWDGATIPRFFWRLIGAKTDNRFLIPSLIHDVLCENHELIDNNRYFSTLIFERLLYVSKVNPFNRWLMKHTVDNFQKFCNW